MSKFYLVNIMDLIDPSGEPAGPWDNREGAVLCAQAMFTEGSLDIEDDLPVVIEVRENGVPLLEAIPRREIDPEGGYA